MLAAMGGRWRRAAASITERRGSLNVAHRIELGAESVSFAGASGSNYCVLQGGASL